MDHPQTPLPPATGWHTLALLWAGVCSAGGLVLLAWAASNPGSSTTTRVASGAAGAALVVCSSIVWQLVRASGRLRNACLQADENARSAQSQLRATLDILPDGLAIFDADDHLVLCNTRYTEVTPGIDMESLVGTPFDEVLRRAAQSGQIVDALEDSAGWLANRMARHRAPGPPEVQQLTGDRWVLINERLQPGGGGLVMLRTDITETVHTERALKQALSDAERADRSLREAINAMPTGLEIYDENDRLVLCNELMTQLRPYLPMPQWLGKTYEELLREGLRHGVPKEAQGQEELWLAHQLAMRGHRRSPEVHHYPGGAWMHIHETRTPSGMTVCVRVDISDLIAQRQALETAQATAQQARQLLQDAIECLPDGFVLFDAEDKLLVCNTQYRLMYPISAPMMLPGNFFEDILRYGAQRGQYLDAVNNEEGWLKKRLHEHYSATHAVLQRLPEGRWVQADERRTPQGGIAGIRTDVTHLVRKEQELAAANAQLALLSTTDGLTGIANRRRFDDRLAVEWLRCGRQKVPLTVVLIDIDHFKLYNDHFGHLAGDECLRRLAQLLQNTIRRADEVAARFGGEEFVLLLPDISLASAITVVQRCMDSLQAAAIAHPQSPTAPILTLSMGIASVVPSHEASPDTVVKAADSALYRAKNAGRNRFDVAPPIA